MFGVEGDTKVTHEDGNICPVDKPPPELKNHVPAGIGVEPVATIPRAAAKPLNNVHVLFWSVPPLSWS